MEQAKNNNQIQWLNPLDSGGSENGYISSTPANTRVYVPLMGATKYNTIYFDSEGATAGTFVIEEAVSSAYAGTWGALGTVAVSGGGTSMYVFRCPVGAYGVIAVRDSVQVASGTVNVGYVGN